MSDLEADVPLVKSYVARFAAYAVAENIITLLDLSEPMEQGTFYPLFLICLQQMLKLRDNEWLVNVFNESKMDLQMMLPGNLPSKSFISSLYTGLNFKSYQYHLCIKHINTHAN